MPLFYKEKIFDSKINGRLVFRKFWNGRWLLKIPEGEFYSSSYLEKMWHKALKKVAKEKISQILILGGGAGCAVFEARKFFPQAQMQVIDYDQSIMEIGKEIYQNFDQDSKITFVTDEAQKFVEAANEKYDLILIDLFIGNKISPLLKDNDFLQGLKKISSSSSVFIANAASWLTGKDPELFTAWFLAFPQAKILKFQSNKLIIAKK